MATAIRSRSGPSLSVDFPDGGYAIGILQGGRIVSIVERHVTLAEADAFCLSYNGPDGDCQAVIVPEGVMTSPALFPWGIGGKRAEQYRPDQKGGA